MNNFLRDPAAAPCHEAARLTAKVLVADDELNLRTIAAKLLTRVGCTVAIAGSAEEAIATFDALGGDVDLLITDVVMPGMSGPDLANVLLKRRPGLKVVFTSGYTDDVMLRHGVDGSTVEFLGKPYTFPELVARVESVLAGTA